MKKAAKIKTVVNWFYGNYCTRKCWDNDARLREHWEKLQQLANKLEGLEMTHAEFLNMIRNDRTICTLSDEEWKKNKLPRNNCQICKRFGLR